MTVWVPRSIPSSPLPCLGAPHMSGPLGDRDADQGAVLGPRAVVVLHVLVAEQLAEHEPGVARALTDAAVRDGVLALVETGLGVELGQLLVALEGAVLVGRLAPRHVHGGGVVARPLRGPLRRVCRGPQPCRELLWRGGVGPASFGGRGAVF